MTVLIATGAAFLLIGILAIIHYAVNGPRFIHRGVRVYDPIDQLDPDLERAVRMGIDAAVDRSKMFLSEAETVDLGVKLYLMPQRFTEKVAGREIMYQANSHLHAGEARVGVQDSLVATASLACHEVAHFIYFELTSSRQVNHGDKNYWASIDAPVSLS